MIFTDKIIEINKIALDPNNPRLNSSIYTNQDTLKSNILNSRNSKDLLKSMQTGIKWVNKIVVRKIEDYPYSKENFNNYDYVVIEGNTRLACLKSGEIPNIDESYECPIIIATKSSDENSDDFESQVRVTQGIANVMVVKEWPLVSKAKHLYQMFMDEKKNSSYTRSHEIYKKLAEELGMTIPSIRAAIIRYSFFIEIEKQSESIEHKHWGYLESIDRTEAIRKTFGMTGDFNEFNWELDEESEFKLETIKIIPDMIKKASSEKINSKEFRAIITKMISNNKTSEEIFDDFSNIVNSEDEMMRSILDDISLQTEESKWEDLLDQMIKNISKFPPQSDFSLSLKPKLDDINTKISKLLDFMSDE